MVGCSGYILVTKLVIFKMGMRRLDEKYLLLPSLLLDPIMPLIAGNHMVKQYICNKVSDMELNPNLSLKAQQDIELVEKARKGDQLAYAELLGRYRDAIYFMFLKMVNSPVDAEDLTIEAFGKAFKNIDQYTPNFAFSTWLFKIATNNCIDFIRKKRQVTFHLIKRWTVRTPFHPLH